jgi:hypothetical protein
MRGIPHMRALVLPFVIALLTVGSAAVRPGPRPVVILVHGRGHVDGDSATLRRQWKRDLDSAIAAVGLPRLAAEDLRLAWYADVLDPAFESRCAAKETASDTLGFEGFARGLIGALAMALPRDEAPEARALLGDLLYATDEATRCAAERRVGNAIQSAFAENRPVIVVAYSLGSLVAYGYLNSRGVPARAQETLRLITLGSPLGNPQIRELLGGGIDSLRMPAAVISWENVYDPNDPFAAALEQGAGVRMRDRVTVSPSAEDAHHIGRYLRDPAAGAAIGRALCEAAPDLAEACRRLLAPQKS